MFINPKNILHYRESGLPTIMKYPVQGPAISTDTNKMTVVFKSNHLFRYQGFKCRYRAIQPNGIAVINSFGDTGADSEEGNHFLWV